MHTYDYAIVRVVPRVERGEFVNVGVIVSCDATDSLEARIELDPERVLALDPGADIGAIRAALGAIDAVCAGSEGAGALAKLSPRERFHWLVAPRSAVIQTSPVHTGRSKTPGSVLGHLFETMVGAPRRALPEGEN
ncbi:MAG: DUF3037 domain-containing protein [Burkholderiales bacterium]|nr:DUF3037 domain-containing protein [Burkholderiales bacterium]